MELEKLIIKCKIFEKSCMFVQIQFLAYFNLSLFYFISFNQQNTQCENISIALNMCVVQQRDTIINVLFILFKTVVIINKVMKFSR